jgi:hypothetical protein
MKKIVFICVMFLAAPAFAQLPMAVVCQGETDTETDVCMEVFRAFVNTGVFSGAGEDKFYAMTVIPHEKDNYVAVSLGIDYVDRSCGGLMFASQQAVLMFDKTVDQEQQLKTFSAKIAKSVLEWDAQAIPMIDKLCGRGYAVYVGNE